MAFGGSGFGGNLFGNTQSAFGAPAPVFGQSSSFGASSSGFGAGSSGFGAFGQPQSQSQSLWGTGAVPTFGQQNAFQQQQQQPVGNPQSTRAVKWQLSQLQDSNSSDPSRFHSISAMSQFQHFSVEELRAADYARGDKGNTQSGFGGGGFGASGFGQSSSGFGATNAFGASSQPLFGNTYSAFGGGGGGNTLFGQTQQQQQATGFGSFGQTQSGFGQQPSGFGQSSSAFGSSSGAVFGAAVFGGNTGFGQTAAQSGGFGSGFGSSGGSGFGAASASGFGSQGGGASGFGASGFGASSQALFGGGNQQTGALFGSQQSGSSLFGQQSGASGFGAPTQSAPSLFGGQSAGGSVFGGQQQSGGGLFGGSQSSAGGLFGGGQQSSGGLFGGQQGAGQFGASSSAFGGSSLFGGGGGTQQSASLFGGSTMGSSSGGGLFGSGSGTSLFGNTGSSLFGSGSGSGFGASSANLFGAQPSGSLFGNTGSGFGMSGSMFGSGTGFGLGTQQQHQQQQQQQNGALEASLTNNPFGNSNLFANIPKDSSALVPIGGSQPQGTQGKTVSVVVGPIGGRSRRVRGGDEPQTRLMNGARIVSEPWYRPRARPWSRNGSLFDLDDMMREKDHSRDYITPWRTEEQRVKARNLKKLVIEPIEEDPILTRTSQRPGASVRRKVRSNDETAVPIEQNESPSRASASPMENEADSFEPHEAKDDGEETVVGVEEFETVEPSGKEEERVRTEAAVKKEEAIESARYVPYGEFYRNQFSADRREASYGKKQKQEDEVSAKANMAPICRRAEYKTIPDIEELQNMSEEELSHVENFCVYRENVGDVRWETAVDIRGLNLDEIVCIEPGTVTIYPSNESVPQPGEELNKPAIVRMHGVWKKKGGVVQKDAHAVARMVKNLKHHCDREGLQFLGYDVGTGTWSFRAQRF